MDGDARGRVWRRPTTPMSTRRCSPRTRRALPPRCRALPGHRSAAAYYSSLTSLDPDETATAARGSMRTYGALAFLGIKDGPARRSSDLAARGLCVLCRCSGLGGRGPSPRRLGAAGASAPGRSSALDVGVGSAGSPTETRVPAVPETRPSPSSAGAAGWATTPAASAIARRAAPGCPTSSRQYPTSRPSLRPQGQVASLAPAMPVVGYHRGAPLAAMRRVGFREVGHFRVWVTPP